MFIRYTYLLSQIFLMMKGFIELDQAENEEITNMCFVMMFPGRVNKPKVVYKNKENMGIGLVL